MSQKIKLYMALPSTGSREDAQCYALRTLEKKYSDKIEFIYPPHFVGRMFHDYARNSMVEDFLASGADLMWFLDSDVVPPTNVLDLITEHYDKWQLAGAPYPVWMIPAGFETMQVVYTVYRKIDGKLTAQNPIPYSGTEFVDGIATGCLFIKREVFEKLSKPYFEFKYDTDSRKMVEGEDLGFCKKVSDLGYQFFIDYSMTCRHYKKVDLLEINNYAIQCAKSAVGAHDRAIRQALAQRKLAASRQKSSLILPK